MKLTKLRNRTLCIPHLNGMVPRGRYIGCQECEAMIAAERDVKAVETKKREVLKSQDPAKSRAQKLMALRGGIIRRRKRGADYHQKKAPVMRYSLAETVLPERKYELVWVTVD